MLFRLILLCLCIPLGSFGQKPAKTKTHSIHAKWIQGRSNYDEGNHHKLRDTVSNRYELEYRLSTPISKRTHFEQFALLGTQTKNHSYGERSIASIHNGTYGQYNVRSYSAGYGIGISHAFINKKRFNLLARYGLRGQIYHHQTLKDEGNYHEAIHTSEICPDYIYTPTSIAEKYNAQLFSLDWRIGIGANWILKKNKGISIGLDMLFRRTLTPYIDPGTLTGGDNPMPWFPLIVSLGYSWYK